MLQEDLDMIIVLRLLQGLVWNSDGTFYDVDSSYIFKG